MTRTGTKLGLSVAVALAGFALALSTRNEAFSFVTVIGLVVAALYARDLLRERGLAGDGRSAVIGQNGVSRDLGGGQREHVAWTDLREIEIVTTDGGPYVEDVFWVLHGTQGGCAVPGGDPCVPKLLERIQALPGFDNEQVVRAMGSTGNARFVCWQANASHDPGQPSTQGADTPAGGALP